MRRSALVLMSLVGLTAVWAGGSAPAGANPAAVRTTPDVFYLYHANFNLRYEIEWEIRQGTDTGDCTPWRIDRGVNTVVVQDAPWKRRGERRPRRHGIPGSITMFGRFRPGTSLGIGGWAGGSAVGRASGSVSRTWVQRGGPGGGCEQPFKPTPTDCGNRTFATRTATILYQTRKTLKTLDEATMPSSPRENQVWVFSLSAAPAGLLYRSCMMTDLAPQFPANVAIRLAELTKIDLRRLQPGQSVSEDWRQAGQPCADDLPADTKCTFRVDGDIDITRWKPGTPYP
jgi:hypothetical protein